MAKKPTKPNQHLVDPRLGRPSKLTPDVHDAIIKSIREGNYIQVAAHRAGVHAGTVFRWMQEAEQGHPDPTRTKFRDAVLEAQAQAEAEMVSLVRRAVMGGVVTKEVTRTLRDGTIETETSYSPPDGRVGLDFLSRAYPDRWSRRTAQTIEHTGPGGGPVQVQTEQRFTALAERLRSNATAPKIIEGETTSG